MLYCAECNCECLFRFLAGVDAGWVDMHDDGRGVSPEAPVPPGATTFSKFVLCSCTFAISLRSAVRTPHFNSFSCSPTVLVSLSPPLEVVSSPLMLTRRVLVLVGRGLVSGDRRGRSCRDPARISSSLQRALKAVQKRENTLTKAVTSFRALL